MGGSRAALTAVTAFLPEARRTNETVAREFPEWTAEKLGEKTGIETRRLAADGQYSSDLAIAAARKLFDADPRHREGLDLVLLVTVSPDFASPGTSVLVQDRLGSPQSVGTLDILWGCSGYPDGLMVAAGLIESGRARKVLVLTADRFHPYVDEADVGVKALMGDAATASLLERVEEGEAPSGLGLIGATNYGTDGSGARQLMLPTSGMRGIPEERFVVYLSETGNTAASTVPLALEHAFVHGRVRPGDRVLLVAFGTGWSWSSVVLEVPDPRESPRDRIDA